MYPCNWHLYVCGLNHRSSTLDEREPLQIGPEETARANATLCNIDGVMEATVVSTCNRVELYFVAERERPPFEIAREFFRELKGIDPAPLEKNFYTYQDRDVAEHLFGVAAGIDSMVIGENQILGQIKDAYSSACHVKTAGKVLHGLFHQAFRVGKQVRVDTELGKGACSVSSATVDLLKSRMDHMAGPVIVFVGVNQMIYLAASGLHRRGHNRFIFVNRTEAKAHDLAVRFRGDGRPLTQLPAILTEADVLISCTSSPDPIITDQTLAERLAANPQKRLLIADMAVPRDVELKNHYPAVELYDLEDVRKYVRESQAHRERAIPQARQLINYRLEQFVYWFEHIRYEPGYNGLGDAFEQIRRQELSRILGALPDETRDVVDQASRRLVQKLLQLKLRTSETAEKME